MRFRGRDFDGSGVCVAVVDSGIDQGDPRLSGAEVDGWALTMDATGHACVGADTADVHGHGTEVAAVLHRRAPGARLLGIRVADADFQTTAELMAAGVESACREGARIINVSIGAADPGRARVLQESCARVRALGSVVVAASHPEGRASFPADLPQAVGVLAHPDCQERLFHLPAHRFPPAEFAHLSGKFVAPGYAAPTGEGEPAYLGSGIAAAEFSAWLACIAEAQPHEGVDAWLETLRHLALVPDPEFGYA
jgi:hypothetical protein